MAKTEREWKIDGEENRGLGMWGYEFFGATTLYLDSAKTWNFALFAAYELHSKKEGTDVRVGDILTLEGGLGKTFMQGMVNVGVTYYAQWKVTNDDFGLQINLPGGPLIGKHQVYGVGPEVSIPLATKKKLYGFLTLRYIWETGARTMLEGEVFMVCLGVVGEDRRGLYADLMEVISDTGTNIKSAELWSRDGELLAQSRQLAILRAPAV